MLKRYSKCGKLFTEEEIALIREIVKENYHTSRCEISREVCRRLNWYSENGKPKQWVCREFLISLEMEGVISLPPPMPCSFNRLKKTKFDGLSFREPERVFEGRLGDFGKPLFKRVRNPLENTLWEYLVRRYHYLGYKGVMGRFLKYLIYLEDTPVALTGFSGASLRVRCRDEFIGWDEVTRRSNLKHIVNNFRFLILPWARVKYLASHILSKNIALLVRDWKEQYNVEVYLVETFVERGRFEGTSYRASNWHFVGTTRGYGKTKTSYTNHGIIKDVYLYPVCRDFLRLLRCKDL